MASTQYSDGLFSQVGSMRNGKRGTPTSGPHTANEASTASRIQRRASRRLDLPDALAPKMPATGSVGRDLSYAGNSDSSTSSRMDLWLATRKLRSTAAIQGSFEPHSA